ncbi:ABC transporter ATP-binding protein [Thermodesulfobacteriota bacterium B35]
MLVSTAGLQHGYRRGPHAVEVLRGVDLEVDAGEFVAIMGPSGSGKSTLLHILGCLVRPLAGSYLLAGTDVLSLPEKELAAIRASRIGFVFQMFHLLPALDVLRNVSLPFLYNGIAPDRARRLALAAIGRVGLAHRVDHRPCELSGGEMQRAAIARALAVEPELILADEPTGNLDAASSGEILELFARLHRSGRTIIMVTHDPAVAAMAQRILRLEDGRLA